MAVLSNAAIFYESGQSQKSYAEMSDSGDHIAFTLADKPWSNAAGFEYTVTPYGLATGGEIIPAASSTSDAVDVAALTAYMPGATGASATTGILVVAADTDVVCTRGADANTAYRINSITINSSGAIAAVAGTGSTAHSETRGAAGGPPFIPVGSVEIGQVRFTSHTSADVTSGEIYQVVGTHQERYDSPVYSVDPIRGRVTFSDSLPLIHTASVPKKVYARVATPLFAQISRARDWVPAETSNSVASEAYYDGTVGSYSSSLGQASFNAAQSDGVTDAMLAKVGQELLFKFMPDRNKSPYQITQGVLAVSRTFGVGANPSAAFTISASQASVDFAS